MLIGELILQGCAARHKLRSLVLQAGRINGSSTQMFLTSCMKASKRETKHQLGPGLGHGKNHSNGHREWPNSNNMWDHMQNKMHAHPETSWNVPTHLIIHRNGGSSVNVCVTFIYYSCLGSCGKLFSACCGVFGCLFPFQTWNDWWGWSKCDLFKLLHLFGHVHKCKTPQLFHNYCPISVSVPLKQTVLYWILSILLPSSLYFFPVLVMESDQSLLQLPKIGPSSPPVHSLATQIIFLRNKSANQTSWYQTHTKWFTPPF